MTRAPNLDRNDKLVKRSGFVSWDGLTGIVCRVRTGRCLVRFPGARSPVWLICRSVQVVPLTGTCAAVFRWSLTLPATA